MSDQLENAHTVFAAVVSEPPTNYKTNAMFTHKGRSGMAGIWNGSTGGRINQTDYMITQAISSDIKVLPSTEMPSASHKTTKSTTYAC